MRQTLERCVIGAVFACGLLFAYGAVEAQAASYPDRALRLTVPYPPGGGTDVLARIISRPLGEQLGQSVVVENKPGAGGTIGAASASRAAADGYELLIVNSMPHTASEFLYKKLTYDPVNDFKPVGLFGTVPYILVVNPSMPINSLKELVEAAGKSPGFLDYGSAGTGSSTHLVAELFSKAAAIEMNHVPYKGGGPAITDLMAGHIGLTFENIAAVIGHIQSGSLKALATTGKERSALLPDVPTIAESGYPDFEVTGSFGLVAPKNTSDAHIQVLNSRLHDVLKDEAVRDSLLQQGATAQSGTPEELDQIIRSDSHKYEVLIKAIGITPN